MGTYRLSKKADEDLADLYRYGIRNFGVIRADLYFNSLCAHLESIANAPMLYQLVDLREGYRRSVHYPHAIYYRIIESDNIEIVRILRGQAPETAL